MPGVGSETAVRCRGEIRSTVLYASGAAISTLDVLTLKLELHSRLSSERATQQRPNTLTSAPPPFVEKIPSWLPGIHSNGLINFSLTSGTILRCPASSSTLGLSLRANRSPIVFHWSTTVSATRRRRRVDRRPRSNRQNYG